jgi:hypothetical protein
MYRFKESYTVCKKVAPFHLEQVNAIHFCELLIQQFSSLKMYIADGRFLQ